MPHLEANKRIHMSEKEAMAVDKLLAKHGPGSLTRRDANESGPVLVHIGDHVYEVNVVEQNNG